MCKKIFLLLLIFLSSLLNAKKADLVIFSFDRPLQLYALLESVSTYMTGVKAIYVVYRVSNNVYDRAYEEVQNHFADIHYLKQGDNPYRDFKRLTLRAVFNDSPSDYIIFAVDDLIVTNYVDLSECIKYLDRTNAYFFSLRLGKNITNCYMANSAIQKLPNTFQFIENNVYQWRINTGVYDWGYPHSVDLHLYRKKDIISDFKNLLYHSPNSLEGSWSSKRAHVVHRMALCFEHSCTVNIPANLVQSDYKHNRNMNAYSTQDLLNIFNQGKKIDIQSFYALDNDSPWIELEYTFVER